MNFKRMQTQCYKLLRKRGRFDLEPIKKAYGYVTRMKEGTKQVLVFQHSIVEAGIQIPKGTVKPLENPDDAVCREIKEETGLKNFDVDYLIADDFWENSDGTFITDTSIK